MATADDDREALNEIDALTSLLRDDVHQLRDLVMRAEGSGVAPPGMDVVTDGVTAARAAVQRAVAALVRAPAKRAA